MPATTDPHDNPDNRPAQSRLEAEIAEILERAEREHPSPPPISFEDEKRRRARPQVDVKATFRDAGQHARTWLTAAPILVAFGFAVLANTFDDFSPFLARTMVSAAVIAFFWPVLEGFRNRQSGPPPSRTWRGRDMGPPPSEQRSPIDSIRQWLRDRRLLP